MKIRLLVASANLGNDRSGGLHEEHDVAKERAEYLIEIGAAEAVKETPASKKAETETEKKAEEPKTPAPKKAAPAPRPATRKQS